MWYELFFHALQDAIPSEESLVAYFAENPSFSAGPWEEEEMMGLRFFYQHDDTGVNFSFLFERDCDQVADYTPPGYVYPGLSFRMKTGHALFYAMEAMPLVADFCARFGLLADDPQEETVAPADERELIRSWMRLNVATITEVEPEERPNMIYAPMEKTTAWWRYTYWAGTIVQRSAVPYIFWSQEENGTAVTIMQWEDGVPTLFPPCDYVHLRVEEGGMRGLRGRADGMVRYDEVMVSLASYLTPHQTPFGPIPELKPGGDVPLGEIISRYELIFPEPLYTRGISPDMLHEIDPFGEDEPGTGGVDLDRNFHTSPS